MFNNLHYSVGQEPNAWSSKSVMLKKQTCLIIKIYRKPLHSLAMSTIISVSDAHFSSYPPVVLW